MTVTLCGVSLRWAVRDTNTTALAAWQCPEADVVPTRLLQSRRWLVVQDPDAI